MRKFDYAIYHKNCPDGFSSLMVLLLSKRLDPGAIIMADVPSAKSAPSQLSDRNVIVMDVAYKYEVLKEIVKQANSVIFIDHHITIADDVQKIKEINPKKLTVMYDLDESGASLTWKYLFGNKPYPLFIKYIRDNDIGLWEHKDTKPFSYALRVKFDIDLKRDTIRQWYKLFRDSNVIKMIKYGRIYEEYADVLIEENSRKYSLETFPSKKIYDAFPEHFDKSGQYKAAVICGSGCPNFSLLAKKILENGGCDFVVAWNLLMDKNEYRMSFRSKHVDVGTFASLFGGGGHEHASSCSISADEYDIRDLFESSRH